MTTVRGQVPRIHPGWTMDCRVRRGKGKANDKGKTDG
jgi:hypothetical protein